MNPTDMNNIQVERGCEMQSQGEGLQRYWYKETALIFPQLRGAKRESENHDNVLQDVRVENNYSESQETNREFSKYCDRNIEIKQI